MGRVPARLFRRVPERLRVPLVAGLAMVIIAGAAVVVLSSGGAQGGHLVANRDQLKRACGGLLPYEELRGLVPDDVRGEAHAYGTRLTPDEESRALLNCSVTWPDRGGVEVAAVPILSRLPDRAKLEAEDLLPASGMDGDAYEAPGVTGRSGGGPGAWVVAECPAGLRTRGREVTGMYVTASAYRTGAGAQKSGTEARALRDVRTAVTVANALTRAQKCGGAAIPLPDAVVDTYDEKTTSDPDGSNWEVERIDIPGSDAAKCRGLGKDLGGRWSVAGDLQDSRLLSVCDATPYERTDPSAESGDVKGVHYISAASWAGPLSEAVDESYEDHGASYGFRAGERTKELREGEPVSLALWAGGQCAAGRTLHRVSVSLDFGGHSSTLTERERTRLSTQARKTLDGYLADPGGWPRQQRCHDTEILGEVEGWR
ncbi:hypothetical protein [Streptomyces sp. N35]|uniref:hypothetical protein n=1 Tax=Streptomyces sp. N35 TaxID=2795730 RepID=UPI0018F73E80|nr:hypothetical protein [Streptomyces sp. N35]